MNKIINNVLGIIFIGGGFSGIANRITYISKPFISFNLFHSIFLIFFLIYYFIGIILGLHLILNQRKSLLNLALYSAFQIPIVGSTLFNYFLFTGFQAGFQIAFSSNTINLELLLKIGAKYEFFLFSQIQTLTIGLNMFPILIIVYAFYRNNKKPINDT